jgi:hypothetical protein
MSGYQPLKKIYNLTFVQYPGLEISIGSTSLGKLIEISQVQLKINSKDENERLAVFRFFADKLKSWNIMHPEIDANAAICDKCGLSEGAPLPATMQGIMCLDLDFVMDIIIGWMTAVSRVSDPKGENSNNGEMSIPEDMMTKLGMLQNPMKLPTPN